MRLSVLTPVALIGWATVSAAEGPDADVRFIVQSHMIRDGYEEEQHAIARRIVSDVRIAVEAFGVTVIDDDLFEDALVGNLFASTDAVLRETAIRAFREVLTPGELAELAEYYRSEEGQRHLAGDSEWWSISQAMWLQTFGPGAPVKERRAALLWRMEAAVAKAEDATRAALSMDRVADILARQDIVAFANEAERSRVVAAIREDE